MARDVYKAAKGKAVEANKGGDYIVACTSTRDRSLDLDPSNFCAWPLDRTEMLVLTLGYPALTTPINQALIISKLPPRPSLTA